MALDLVTPPPDSIEYYGTRYRLCPYFDNVLMLARQLDGCTGQEQLRLMKRYLFIDYKSVPNDAALILRAMETIAPTEKKTDDLPKALDIDFDADLIYAAFRQTYGIDLYAECGKMHWQIFRALLLGLPDGTRLGDVMRIRTEPLPAPTRENARARASLARAKIRHALPVKEKERGSNLKRGLAKLADMLLSMAGKEE